MDQYIFNLSRVAWGQVCVGPSWPVSTLQVCFSLGFENQAVQCSVWTQPGPPKADEPLCSAHPTPIRLGFGVSQMHPNRWSSPRPPGTNPREKQSKLSWNMFRTFMWLTNELNLVVYSWLQCLAMLTSVRWSYHIIGKFSASLSVVFALSVNFLLHYWLLLHYG